MPLPLRRVLALVAWAALALLLAGGVAIGAMWRDRHGPTEVVVDASRRYQTLDGWAVYPRYWEDDKQGNRFDRSFEPHTERVSQVLVDEIGINAARVEIWSGLENPHDHWLPHYEGRTSYYDYAPHRYEKINDNDDPRVADPAGFQFSKFDHRLETMVLPIQRALERRGEKLFVNVCYVDFKWNDDDQQGTLSHADEPEEFAEFVLVFFLRLREKYGIVPDAFEVILEPDNTERWRGARIGRALVAVSDRLREHGFTPRMVAPSAAAMEKAILYFDQMEEVPGAIERLDTFSYHRYHREASGLVERIWERAERHGKKTAMLEKIGAGIDVLFEDLVVGHVSAWQQWAAAYRTVSEDTGNAYALVDDGDPANPRAWPSRTALMLSQVFLHARRGAVRVEATSDRRDKPAVAFVNTDGGHSVVVRARHQGGALSVRGLPAGRYGLRFVSDAREVEALAEQSIAAERPITATLPGPGALAIHAIATP